MRMSTASASDSFQNPLSVFHCGWLVVTNTTGTRSLNGVILDSSGSRKSAASGSGCRPGAASARNGTSRAGAKSAGRTKVMVILSA